MLSNLSNGTSLYMKSPEGDRLEVITLTHGPKGPLFTVTPNTCRYDGRKEINLPHLLGFYNLYVAIRQGAPRYLGNPFAIMFLLDGDEADKSLETVETERLKAEEPEPEAKPEPKEEPKPEPKEEETVPCACCDPDYDDEDYLYNSDEDDEDDGGTEVDGMNAFMAAVAASSMKREEATSLPPIRPEDAEDSEDDEGVPRTYPRYPNRLHLLPRNLSVYVRLPGSHEWHGIFLRKGLFYEDGEGLNEWHLIARYRKRFNVDAGGSSTRGLQAIYVASGVGANESLARLLLERSDAELACVGSTPTPVPSAQEPPAPGAIAAALARIAAKEQALLAELAELDKVQAAMARVAALEARVAEARAALKDI
jgi:hypothetical protein